MDIWRGLKTPPNNGLSFFSSAHFLVEQLKSAFPFRILPVNSIEKLENIFRLDAKFLFAFRASDEKQIQIFLGHS